jgi:hypothetical protein
MTVRQEPTHSFIARDETTASLLGCSYDDAVAKVAAEAVQPPNLVAARILETLDADESDHRGRFKHIFAGECK